MIFFKRKLINDVEIPFGTNDYDPRSIYGKEIVMLGNFEQLGDNRSADRVCKTHPIGRESISDVLNDRMRECAQTDFLGRYCR